MQKHMLIHGVYVPIIPSEVSETIWTALSAGSYEAKEAHWALRAARKGDRILELGAGLGVITTLLASVENARVFAFEADPRVTRLAERTLKFNGASNVELNNGILAAGPSRTYKFFVRDDFWMSSLTEHTAPFVQTEEIHSMDIDAFISETGIDYLVMDIEGAERDLLTTATLPGVERVFIELHDHLYGLHGVNEIIQSMGKKGFVYDPRGSSGACILFSRDRSERQYETEEMNEFTM